MKKEALMEVVAMLRALPAELVPGRVEFHMGEWMNQRISGVTRSRTPVYPMPETEPDCYTQCCVAGWCVLKLPHLGLLANAAAGGEVRMKREDGTGMYDYGYTALAYCFDIPREDAHTLFGWMNPNNPVAMADQIERYVKLRS